ncbi:MAG: DUF1877 family protein [Bacilli bacterium]
MSMNFEAIGMSEQVLRYLQSNHDEIADFAFDRIEGDGFNDFSAKEVLYSCDIGKAWDVIGYVLHSSGLENVGIIFGGQVFDEALDFGYDPVMYMHAEEVRAMAQALPTLSHFLTLLKETSWDEVEVYSFDTPIRDEDEAYITESYDELYTYLQTCKEKNFALMQFIS